MEEQHRGAHLAHCFQGQYPDVCKYGDTDCPAKPEHFDSVDWHDSIRRAELANSYANIDLETLLRDINLLTQIAMFKLHMERLTQQRKSV